MEKWDAETYHKISHIQEAWAKELILNNKWNGDEVVLDAGCGTGKVTNLIARIVNRGRIYAVDIDENMITIARKKYQHLKNVIYLISDITNVNLPQSVDIVFSNAAIHWIPNHHRLFKNFYDMLKPDGKILIQCGGKGNLGKTHEILESLRKEKEFAKYFRNWQEPWYFPSASEAFSILKNTGFRDIHTEISKKTAVFQGSQDYRLFMKTVVMKPYLSYLPSHNDNDTIRDSFIDLFIEQSIKTKDFLNQKTQPSIDYVRLNIRAIK